MSATTFVAEPGAHDMVMSRVFHAPRDLVFKVVTDPNTIPRWWGPRYLTTRVDVMETRHGGVWRFVQHDAEGNEHPFRGVFHEVLAPSLIIQTFEYEPMPGHVALETMTLEDLGDNTRVTTRSVFQTVEDRDGMIASGAEGGAVETWERLAEYLEAQVAAAAKSGAAQ